MKKAFSLLIAVVLVLSLLTTTASAAPTTQQQTELGILKVCKVAGSGVTLGKSFTFTVDGNSFNVPAGAPTTGNCVIVGEYPLNTRVTIQEAIPSGYYVWEIKVWPYRTVSKNLSQGTVVVNIGSGVTEAIFTNNAIGEPTFTPRPTSVNTSAPFGRLQICKEADGSGVTGEFTFRFENRSRTIPAGVCAGLVSVNVGSLTITEVARAGFAVTDIYTIPANRLISRDLSAGTVTVTIVEGTASSQTIVVFRNRAVNSTITSTPTSTSTPTVTATGTGGPICQPTVADFSGFQPGESVEGMGAVVPGLNINAKGTAVKIANGVRPSLYIAPNGSGQINGGLVDGGGFGDFVTKEAEQAHRYTFTFATAVENFSLRMLDYGDLNRSLSTSHHVSMTAYNAANQVVSTQELNFTTLAEKNPRSSDLYGDLWDSGDGAAALPGQPGNWTWNVSGNGIVKIILEFGVGFDPNIGFDLLTIGTDCSSGDVTPTPTSTATATGTPVLACQRTVADFSAFQADQSVEGMGAVAPGLNIDARRTAVKVGTGVQPVMYIAPNGSGIRNGGLMDGGGFGDSQTKQAQQAHRYTFTFGAGTVVNDFSLRMLDFGDHNVQLATSHHVSMTAYNAANEVVAVQELNYTTPAEHNPRSSDLYGDLWDSGDGAAALPGQPGNWTWNVSGAGIVKVVLEFGVGYDPNIAFDTLSFTPACP